MTFFNSKNFPHIPSILNLLHVFDTKKIFCYLRGWGYCQKLQQPNEQSTCLRKGFSLMGNTVEGDCFKLR